MKIIYLKPLSGYATPLRSDTLWGMLCWGIRHLWGEKKLEIFLSEAKAGRPAFVISSTFPYKQYDGKRIPFFPNPLPFPDEHKEDREEALLNAQLRKWYKSAFLFVNIDDFKGILNGTLAGGHLRERLRTIYEEEERLAEEANYARKPKQERVITALERDQTAPALENFYMTHNTINRVRGGTLDLPIEGSNTGETTGQLFHSPEHYWTDKYADPNEDPNTGIFFLADGPDMSTLEPVLRLFRHWGFGADRSSGKGFFQAELDEIHFSAPADANAMLNLSLFRPKTAELRALDEHSVGDNRFQYRIELREGWVGSDGFFLPKDANRFFSEGSIFPLLPLHEGRFLGEIIPQLTKHQMPHPVYDNGFGFMLPLKWPE